MPKRDGLGQPHTHAPLCSFGDQGRSRLRRLRSKPEARDGRATLLTFSIDGHAARRHGGRVMSDLFISYAREDRARIEPLVGAVAAKGWTVWWDANSPPGGKTFSSVIEKELN